MSCLGWPSCGLQTHLPSELEPLQGRLFPEKSAPKRHWGKRLSGRMLWMFGQVGLGGKVACPVEAAVCCWDCWGSTGDGASGCFPYTFSGRAPQLPCEHGLSDLMLITYSQPNLHHRRLWRRGGGCKLFCFTMLKNEGLKWMNQNIAEEQGQIKVSDDWWLDRRKESRKIWGHGSYQKKKECMGKGIQGKVRYP